MHSRQFRVFGTRRILDLQRRLRLRRRDDEKAFDLELDVRLAARCDRFLGLGNGSLYVYDRLLSANNA